MHKHVHAHAADGHMHAQVERFKADGFLAVDGLWPSGLVSHVATDAKLLKPGLP